MGFAMWTRLALVLGLALVLAGVGAERNASAQEVLTNDSVIGLVKAGLPESVVIQKIRSTTAAERKFDTSTPSTSISAAAPPARRSARRGFESPAAAMASP